MLAGIATALGAIVVVSMPEPGAHESHAPRSTVGLRRSDWMLVLGAGLGSAGFFLAFDRAHGEGAGTTGALVTMRLVSVAIVSALIGLAWLRRRATSSSGGRRSAGTVPVGSRHLVLSLGLGASVVDSVGALSYLGANAVGVLSVTVVLSCLYPVATVLLARAFLHERLSPFRLVGVGFALLGAILIGLGAVTA
jgi:drug/metabolite transporter (DMT)-like permease